MDQEIRFCSSANGTRIAYATYDGGPGPPIVQVGGWWMGEEFAGDRFGFQDQTAELAQGWRLSALVRRGTGASQREVEDVSLEAQVNDFTAVVEHIGLEQFDLVGFLDGTAVCTAYAAQHPEQVSGLALYMPNIRGDEAWPPETARSIIELIRSNWPLARRTIAEHYWPHMNSERRRALRDVLQKSVSSEVAAKYFEAISSFDIRSLLPQVRVPTIVIHSPGYGRKTAGLARNSLV